MKFVKGITVCVVLCFAGFGVFTFLKKPPVLHITESEKEYLETLGIGIHDGQASDTGLAGVLNDVQGAPPVGSAMGTFSSSAPPSFLGGTSAPPYTLDTLGTLDTSGPHEPQPIPAPAILPPPNFDDPGEFPRQPSPAEVPHFETFPIPATESPPPWEQDWDGPASDLSATSPPDVLDTPPTPPSTTLHTLPVANVVTVHPPDGGTTIRRIEADAPGQADAFSSANSQPIHSAPSRYTQTSVRQTLVFEPAKPAADPNEPVIAFAAPKRTYIPPPPPPQHQQSEPPRPIGGVAVAPVAAEHSPIRDMIERYLQSQGQLLELGEPENIRLAFVQLSQLYEYDQLGESDRAMMRPMLDALALRVIYARDSHILEPPYQVKPGETIETIARDFNLNAALLRKINGLSMSQSPPAGTILKVVHGQFDAQISIKRKELTLLLGGLYAGRFPLALPNPDISAQHGEVFVTDKTDGMIVLSNGWILATASTKDATILLADHDAREIFDILSPQSVFVVE